MKTGKLLKRADRPQRRKPTQKTPCQSCPKGSPENERYCLLSERNNQTLKLFLAARAAGLLNEAEKNDPIIVSNFALLEQLFTHYDHRRNAEAIGTILSTMGK